MSFKREIQLGDTRFIVIDLTEPLDLDVEVFPGDPKPKKDVFSDINKTRYQHHVYHVSDHNFHPHGDAPKHQNLDSQEKGFEIYDLDYCFNKACFVDLSSLDEDYAHKVKKEHIEPYKNILSQCTAIIIRTGYDRSIEDNEPHVPGKIPFISKDAADLIAAFDNIKVVGIDSITIDPLGEHYAHQILKDRLIVESLVHLYDIPVNSFHLQTSPVRIRGATGGPVVAYAFIKKNEI